MTIKRERYSFAALVFLMTLSFSQSAQAVIAFRWFPAFSVFSLRVAQVIPPVPPLGIVKGVIVVVDPPASTLFSGRVALEFDPALMAFGRAGWLGAWGADPTLAAPPVIDALQYPAGTLVSFQEPHPDLMATVSVDPVNGTVVADYDWGADGFFAAEAMNFFAVEFEFLVPATGVTTVSAGTGDIGASIALDANLNLCTPNDSEDVQRCGENRVFPAFELIRVPEPSVLALLMIGIASIRIFLARPRAQGVGARSIR